MTLLSLSEKYPNAFKYKAENFGFDRSGFQCDDGWAVILEPVAKYLHEYNSGHAPPIKVVQIKQKFGGLRVYVQGVTPELRRLIDVAEQVSYLTCEVCGETGELRRGRWIQTLCDRHQN